MAIKVHDLKPAEGSTKNAKRKGRGIGGKGGKTAGRGTKGQHSRGRGKVRAGFEGGQMPLHIRTPKLRGFTNPFRVEYQAINLDTIAESGLSEVSPEALLGKGLVSKNALIKVLGRGELSGAVTVKAHAFSKSAEEAITAAGGSIEVLPKPWGDSPRPPAQGNQHTNR
ncbi:MAG: 50S ribosomal protein L15 [Acidimicrobiales bacterium]|nr:50S ribosomal protein L15 [Acidimicrobiales bacterium]RZV45168.1 MAG: 50S ribosomal protein L15 [Acidimicrobiales bacterium]